MMNAYDESAQNSWIRRFMRYLVVVIIPIEYAIMSTFEIHLYCLYCTCTVVKACITQQFYKNSSLAQLAKEIYGSISLPLGMSGMSENDNRPRLFLVLVKGQQHKVSGGTLQCWPHCLVCADLTEVCSVMSHADPLSLSQTYQLSGVYL